MYAIADEELHQFADDLLNRAEFFCLEGGPGSFLESYWPVRAKDNTLPKPMFELCQLLDRQSGIKYYKTRIDSPNSLFSNRYL
jgi:hypothetical protein